MYWLLLILLILFVMSIVSSSDSATYRNDSHLFDDDFEQLGYRGGRGDFEVTYTENEQEEIETINNAVSECDAYQKFLFKGSGRAFISAKRKEL